jgi:hypothetical protein
MIKLVDQFEKAVIFAEQTGWENTLVYEETKARLLDQLNTQARIIERMKIRNESRKFLYQCLNTHNKKQAEYIAKLEARPAPDLSRVEGMINKFEWHLRWSYEFLIKDEKGLSEIETDKARETKAALLKAIGGE